MNLTHNTEKPLFIFITGASGAGKTTVLKAIEAKLGSDDISINYFDSVGVPSTEEMIKDYKSGERWQEITTNNWVEKLSKVTDKKLIFLEGQFNPDFAMKPLKRLNMENHRIICLHADKDVREYRLINLRNQPELANADMNNWAEFLKKKTTEIGGIVIQSLEIAETIDKILQAIKDCMIKIMLFVESDIPEIVANFEKNNWPKPASTFEAYLQEQKLGERVVWVAFYNDEFAGYVTLKWKSSYPSFKNQNIPEVMDFNILPNMRNKGIGSALLEVAEKEAAKKNDVVGLGVGLYADYGTAQKLYVKRGYIPDGLGVTYKYQHIKPDTKVNLDDDLVLWFKKKLK